MKKCRDAFVEKGADLGAYNTSENAADFADLRKALKIDSWNVYGVSYGSYDALTSPYFAEQAATKLPHATMVTIPGVGHFVTPKSPCATQVLASFLTDPNAPDTSCVAGLTVPPFE
jgi:pimeloyl-ACP methyl ester carboxylesterase